MVATKASSPQPNPTSPPSHSGTCPTHRPGLPARALLALRRPSPPLFPGRPPTPGPPHPPRCPPPPLFRLRRPRPRRIPWLSRNRRHPAPPKEVLRADILPAHNLLTTTRKFRVTQPIGRPHFTPAEIASSLPQRSP